VRTSLQLIVISLCLAVLACSDDHDRIVDKESCRANMNTLSTDLIVYHSIYENWPEELTEVDDVVGRSFPLVCPSSGEKYDYVLDDSVYVISCPCGEHGHISLGRPSWVDSTSGGG
jgi:hypothetical protein